MKRHLHTITIRVLLSAAMLMTFSCKKMLDIEPETSVDISNHYRNINDANAAVIGIYGQILGIADRYIILNELRADLVSPTTNADQYLREISTHTVSANNPWADPRPFYKIILNCNDALKNFDIMVKAARMRPEEYAQRAADVNAVRAWLYLQLGIHWGEVPYVTDALEDIDALKDQSKYPRLTFNALLDNLIASVSSGYLDYYSAATTTTGATSTSLITTVDGYPTNLFFINKRCLLGDLYLWRGRYTDAATQYRYVTEQGYRNDGASTNTGFWQFKPNYNVFNVAYSRAGDETSLIDDNTSVSGWRAIFGAATQGTEVNTEWIWSLPFDKNFAPTNPLIDLFSNQGGRYLLTASQYAVDKWNSETQNNGFPYDARGRFSVRNVAGQRVIMKPLYNYLTGANFTPGSVLQKQGRWLLYRSGTLNLHFAEAACRDNYVDVAYSLTNAGVLQVFSSIFPTPAAISSGRNVPTDATNIMITNKPAPYDLDARYGDVPLFRAPWHRQIGTRTRANLTLLPIDIINGGPNRGGDMIRMENAIIDEDGLELAFEGQRWGDLLRIALRRNDPSFIASRVYQKLLRDGNGQAGAAQTKLSTVSGLYLPFKL
ncbi:RagB/SusD family nutrient uptake outer membrane protein [Mucilaginibacter daejeonensis]|uniref:RagB/SusD family nutrient uptake outer membrane protein n=1 Tax=Mucilaginibacter daejeonensis TaxID=398049 RepID=UPI001D1772D1|nr:RagB/SusD family nutrient uptake outer membrane protein [Mucilaginibacter daejeonensis]UEG55000.1 RagB/SusD family nutrient uptake outer membrane protein [Mucilaginibacter daejeonensis]